MEAGNRACSDALASLKKNKKKLLHPKFPCPRYSSPDLPHFHSQASTVPFPGIYCPIPRPLPQASTAPFPGLYCPIPRPLLPHSQASTAPFPGLYCPIPRPLPPHSQASTVPFPGLSTQCLYNIHVTACTISCQLAL